MKYHRLFSSESVSEGHPDKVADQISDAILDAVLAQDPQGRVACETFVSTGLVLVGGEITTSGFVDIDRVVRGVIKEIGYNDAELGFDSESCAVLSAIGKQSPDIALGVNEKEGGIIGAGDQGIMFGYACCETEQFMPAPIMYAHKLMRRQATLRKEGTIAWLRPDAKSQVTLLYNDQKQPIGVDTVVLSTQHADWVKYNTLVEAVIEEIIKPVFPKEWITKETRYLVNPTGRFVIGGPRGDCGVTGRKIIIDTYGGMAHHGGGAFSGKDPTKVDRSASYAARYVAKNIVRKGLADICEIQLAYAIGVAQPVSIIVDTFGTGKLAEDEIITWIEEHFDLTPRGIIKMLDLRRPIYRATASYGHFGREEPHFTWEKSSDLDGS